MARQSQILAALVLLSALWVVHLILQNYFLIQSTKFRPPTSLVAFVAVGQEVMIPTVIHNLDHFAGWKCIVFVYASQAQLPSDLPSMLRLSDAGCQIERYPGLRWGEFLWKLDADVTRPYKHVAIVLDDVYMPFRGPRPVSIATLVEQLDRHNLSSISPAVEESYYPESSPRDSVCLWRVARAETFLTIFSQQGWKCLYDRLEVENKAGICYDVMFGRHCGPVGVNYGQIAYHQRTPDPTGSVQQNAEEVNPGFHLCTDNWNSPEHPFLDEEFILACPAPER